MQAGLLMGLGSLICCAAALALGKYRLRFDLVQLHRRLRMAALPVATVGAVLGSAAAFAFVLDAVKVPAFRHLGVD